MDYSGLILRAYCAEQGPWRGVLSFLEGLHQLGATVQVQFLGYLEQLNAQSKLDVPSWCRLPDTQSVPSLNVFGSCQGANQYPEVAQTFRTLLRRDQKVLYFEDAFGSGIPCLTAIADMFPIQDQQMDICVADNISRDHLLRQATFVPPSMVSVTGNPELDSLVRAKDGWDQRRKYLRSNLVVRKPDGSVEPAPASEHEHVVLIAGGQSGTANMVSLLHRAAESGGYADTLMVVRPHPTKIVEDDAHLLELLQESPRTGSWFRDVLAPHTAKTADDLLALADLVLTAYTNTGRNAVYLGLPVAFCGTDAVLHSWREDKQTSWPPVPVQQGAAWDIRDVSGMRKFLDAYLGVSTPEIARERQAVEHAQYVLAQQCDGDAVNRLLAVAEGLIY